MISEYRKGYVYVQTKLAGIISEIDTGYVFSYTKEYLEYENAPAVSLSLPVTDTDYYSTILFPFFDGLIPEGWLLDLATKNWKINQNDRFGLLLAVCRDCIGDVWIRNEVML